MFDSLLREALEACAQEDKPKEEAPPRTPVTPPVKIVPIRSKSNTMPVVVSPDPKLTNTTTA